MGLDVSNCEDKPDWLMVWPSLLRATALILAIRIAKWPANFAMTESNRDLEKEIEYAIHLAGHVFSTLVHRKQAMFLSKKEPWYIANDEGAPK
jgi:hypothetical protein